jgi:hypothetical protein
MTKLSALLFTGILAASVPSFADGRWAATHPRRDQVNDRLANQNRRTQAGVADGQLSRRQATQIHREDRAIRSEERADASMHDGHITKGEQRQINRQENHVSRQIYRERH